MIPDLPEENDESVAIYLVVEEIIQSYPHEISIIVQLILSIHRIIAGRENVVMVLKLIL